MPTRRSLRALATASSLATAAAYAAAGSRPLVLSLEGNIGAGKSTLLRVLEKRGIRTIDEPLKQWQGGDEGGANLLELFYTDPVRWGFTFQTAAFLSRAQAATGALRDAATSGLPGPCVLERSLQSDKHCFATNCLKTGLFTQAEWGVYADFHKWLVDEQPVLKLDGAIYMHARPSTCMERLRHRDRAEEAGMELEYLEQLHARHEEWLRPNNGPGEVVRTSSDGESSDGTPVLVLDCEGDFLNSEAQQAELVGAIEAFAAKLEHGLER